MCYLGGCKGGRQKALNPVNCVLGKDLSLIILNFVWELLYAVVAQTWLDGIGDPNEIPSLETWRDKTGFPWFGFWIRELLRWGTLDPLTAFALAQGLATTRAEAIDLRPQFEAWLYEMDAFDEADDMIDPRLFITWQDSVAHETDVSLSDDYIEAELSVSSYLLLNSVRRFDISCDNV
jgi:hypothetical protein